MRDRNVEGMAEKLAKHTGLMIHYDSEGRPGLLTACGPSLWQRVCAIEEHLGITIEFGPNTVTKNRHDNRGDALCLALDALKKAEAYLQGVRSGKEFEESDLVAIIKRAIERGAI